MKRKISIAHDKEADVVYLSFADEKAEAEEVEEGVFARYNPKTKELIGFTVVDFSKRFAKEPREIAIPTSR